MFSNSVSIHQWRMIVTLMMVVMMILEMIIVLVRTEKDADDEVDYK
jgi:hypothetical protein